jgi:hypothetical protein
MLMVLSYSHHIPSDISVNSWLGIKSEGVLEERSRQEKVTIMKVKELLDL